MNLSEDDIQYIKAHLGEWLAEQSLSKPPAVYEIELRERMVRVEEELKHQRELLIRMQEQMDKRFEQMDNRFDVLTQRLEQFMRWSFGITITTGALVVAILRLTG